MTSRWKRPIEVVSIHRITDFSLEKRPKRFTSAARHDEPDGDPAVLLRGHVGAGGDSWDEGRDGVVLDLRRGHAALLKQPPQARTERRDVS